MKRSLPNMPAYKQARALDLPKGLSWDVPPQALERWQPNVMAAQSSDNTISILDPIGFDPFSDSGGVTAKRITAALRAIGAENDVVVNINSPGGDLFEGLAIYSALREHKGEVTVKVLGLAASAASLIAMAGDVVQIARAGFLMIHDTWVVAVGNRNDLRDVADTLEPFDRAMADIYAARSGIDAKQIGKMMDAETWIGGADAVEQGFADSLLPSDEVARDKQARGERIAAYVIDATMARAGVPRTQRRALLQDIKGGAAPAAPEPKSNPIPDVTPSAGAGSGTHIAAEGTPGAAQADELLSSLRAFAPTI